jgi:hypothetical protein
MAAEAGASEMTHTPEQLRKALEIAYLVVPERERRRTRAVAHQAALAAIVATEAETTEKAAKVSAMRTVAGEPQVPDAEAIEIWRLIEHLTDGEGDTVNVLCPNPDFNGQPNYAIECNGYWTNWEDRRFAADRQVECFRLAFAEMRSHLREPSAS